MDSKSTVKRIFNKPDSSGIMKSVTVEWDPTSPMSSFQVEADGFKGEGCLETLKEVEHALGTPAIEMKIEGFDGEKDQDVFIVGGV